MSFKAKCELEDSESQVFIEGTPECDTFPGGDATPPPTASAPPAYASALSHTLSGDYGSDAEDPVMLYLSHIHRCANEAASAYKSSRKRNRDHFERVAKENTTYAAQACQAEATTKDLRNIIGRLEVECATLAEENAAAQSLRMELDGLKDRIQEADMLEKQNAQLGKSILGLRKDLADADSIVKSLHNEMAAVVENHSKKLRLIG